MRTNSKKLRLHFINDYRGDDKKTNKSLVGSSTVPLQFTVWKKYIKTTKPRDNGNIYISVPLHIN